MSSAQQNNVIYSENNWNDIVKKYNLYNEIELVIREENNLTDSSASTAGASPWLLRAFIVTGVLALLGNLPVQSHLLTTSKSSIQTFEISNDELRTTDDSVTKHSYTDDSHTIDKFTDILDEGIDSQELTLPKRALETYAGHAINDKNSKWKTYHVKSYDNLTNIFYKLGQKGALKTLKQNDSIYKELKKLKKGSIVRANSKDGKLSELLITHDSKNSFAVTLKNNEKYAGTWKQNIFEVRQSRSSFTIRNGLFFDGRKSGVDNQIIKQIVKVFDWDIDFSHDVRVGDKVTAVFEEIYHDGDRIGVQNLLAAEFINKNRQFRAIRYTNKDGKTDYFTPQGREMKKAFIRTPIAHARVSSHFNPGRFHPILHKIRAHKGTDFAARTGTPIMATGNGTIKSIGRKGGYGRTIIVQHREGYTTLYAHMSRYRKGLKTGDKVYQGDTIGYVGSSGLATGPHLHYEFRKNNKAMDSMRASLPNSMSLSSRELQDFRNKAINLVLQLNVLHRFVKAKIEINSAIGG